MYIQSIACHHRLISRARARVYVVYTRVKLVLGIVTRSYLPWKFYISHFLSSSSFQFLFFFLPFFLFFFFFSITKEQIRNSIKIWLLKFIIKEVYCTLHSTRVSLILQHRSRISTSNAKKLQLREKFCDKSFTRTDCVDLEKFSKTLV